MPGAKLENWDAGDAYERFMGGWSRTMALHFLHWLDIDPGQRWLDVGCGTGALASTIAGHSQARFTSGLDPSLGFATYAAQQTEQVSFMTGYGDALPLGDQTLDVVVSGLALNFMPDPAHALSEVKRVIRSGGMAAAYVWDYAGKMEFLRFFWDAAVVLDGTASTLHEGTRFPLCQPDPLRDLWIEAGFRDVSIEALDIPTHFTSFEDYWQPFVVGDFPAPHYTNSLDEGGRTALHDHLRDSIPTQADGSLHLTARAWAVRGYR